LESLALCYRYTLDQLESVLATRFDVVNIVGGGINNHLLNELSAFALNRPVVCGPVEAAATGNLLVQAMGCGNISTIEELREIVARSFDLQHLDDNLESELEAIPPEIYAFYLQLVEGKKRD
jgi:rhamnulokinase